MAGIAGRQAGRQADRLQGREQTCKVADRLTNNRTVEQQKRPAGSKRDGQHKADRHTTKATMPQCNRLAGKDRARKQCLKTIRQVGRQTGNKADKQTCYNDTMTQYDNMTM